MPEGTGKKLDQSFQASKMQTVRFLPDAELEFRESALWYLSQQKGLEAEFVSGHYKMRPH